MNRGEFEQVVDDVLAGLPEWVIDRIDNLAVVVADHPTREQDPGGTGLLGLYDGVPLPERGIDYFAYAPDRIVIFYRSHLAMGLDDASLRDEIRVTVLHEIGHHLGFDDHRLRELGWG